MTSNVAQESHKSSAQILDEIFRELEEKTSSGEIAVTDLARLIAQVKDISSDSEEESERSLDKTKKKHKHKHKKSKKHKKKHKHRRSSDISDEKVEFVESEDVAKRYLVKENIENNVSKQETDTNIAVETTELNNKPQNEFKSGPEEPKSVDFSSEEVKEGPQELSKAINGDSVCPVIEEEGDEDEETKGTKRKKKKQKGTTSKTLKSSIVCVSEPESAKKKKKKKKKKKIKGIKRFTSPLSLTRRRFSSSRSSSSRSRSRSRDSPSNGHCHGRRSESPKSRRSRRSGSKERKGSRSKSPSEVIDKVKLLEIARKNAMAMMAQGRLPPGLPAPPKAEEPVFRRTGKSVAELTDFCKLISEKEFEDDEIGNDGTKIGSGDGKTTFIHHPFKPRERQPDIVMRIRNAVQIPTKTSAEKVAESSTKLRIQFPVSSGTQHRKKESEWVPVSPDKEQIDKSSTPLAIEAPNVPLALPAPPPPPPPLPPPLPVPPPVVDCVFPEQPAVRQLDIGSIVSQRLQAVRKLMDNPHDIVALTQMYKSQKEMQCWAQSKHLPGQFTGTTDLTILTPQQLAGPAHSQAWVRKEGRVSMKTFFEGSESVADQLSESDHVLFQKQLDQFTRATPVQSGFGMHMLQKMGWKPGEGLGKNKEGAAEPLMLDIKLDKKGLVSQDEIVRKNRVNNVPIVKDLSGKHPVSALGELCSKRRWHPPEYTVVFDGGPEHKKNFVFKVKVNGVEYQPTIASLNKKHAKAQCATVCLQAFGLVCRDLNNPL